MDSTQKLLRGTELKMLINFSYPADNEVTLDTIDWYTEWYVGTYSNKTAVRLEKKDCKRVEEEADGSTTVAYYAYVDTTSMRAGAVIMRFMAYIPNGDASESKREEYIQYATDVILY